MVVVAQLVRASVCGTEGRRFEPGLPPKKALQKCKVFFIHKKIVQIISGRFFSFIYFLFKISNPKILITRIDKAVNTVTKSRMGFPAHSKYRNLCSNAKV